MRLKNLIKIFYLNTFILCVLASCQRDYNQCVDLVELVNIKFINDNYNLYCEKIVPNISYRYPYNYYIKIVGSKSGIDSFLTMLNLARYTDGYDSTKLFLITNYKMRGYGNKDDVFSMDSHMPVFKQFEKKIIWWKPDKKNLKNNYASYYNDTIVTKLVSFKESNGRIVVQRNDENTVYILIELTG